MKKLLLASAALIVAISTASAADLSPRMVTKAPPPVPMFSWTGFYVGLNVGGKWATTDGSVSSAAVATPAVAAASLALASSTDSTIIGGGQVGYNWQAPGSNWVFGVEGDIDAQKWSTTRGVAAPFPTAVPIFIPGDTFTVESDWQASLRGRIGYAWDRTLLYATGGVAFTQVKTSAFFAAATIGINPAVLAPAVSASDTQTLVGGTVGAGLEYAMTNNLSLGVEGRYTWYGSQDFNAGPLAVAAIGTTLVTTPVTQHINLNTAEVMGKINFKFW